MVRYIEVENRKGKNSPWIFKSSGRSSASAGCLKSTWIWRKSVRVQICTYTFG